VDDHPLVERHLLMRCLPLGPPVTNQSAGAVYLFDDTGGWCDVYRTGRGAFGKLCWAISMLDAGRVVIGSHLTGSALCRRTGVSFNLGGVAGNG
jgi:hypothetical protein